MSEQPEPFDWNNVVVGPAMTPGEFADMIATYHANVRLSDRIAEIGVMMQRLAEQGALAATAFDEMGPALRKVFGLLGKRTRRAALRTQDAWRREGMKPRRLNAGFRHLIVR